MSTKKIKKGNFTDKVSNVVETAKTSVKKANDYALSTTEEVVTETLFVASQWQNVADKALKGSVKLLDNQQNLIFDTLDTYKKHFLSGKKRITKVFT
jgi:hypothetical protein